MRAMVCTVGCSCLGLAILCRLRFTVTGRSGLEKIAALVGVGLEVQVQVEMVGAANV